VRECGSFPQKKILKKHNLNVIFLEAPNDNSEIKLYLVTIQPTYLTK